MLHISRQAAPNHTEPIDTSKPTTGHGATFREIRYNSRPEHRHKTPQPGSHHRTLVQLHPQGAESTTRKNCDVENFFQFLLLNHNFYSSYNVTLLMYIESNEIFILSLVITHINIYVQEMYGFFLSHLYFKQTECTSNKNKELLSRFVTNGMISLYPLPFLLLRRYALSIPFI